MNSSRMEPDHLDAARDRLDFHGGDLAAARALYPEAPAPWIDLSTGINPVPYPVGDVEPAAWQRLPGPEATHALEAAAAEAYGARATASVVAAPGTQGLLQWLPRLLPARRVRVLGFTYAEHERVWRAAGAAVETVEDPEALADAELAVVVNPNNPDGRCLPAATLLALSERLARRGGRLVVDEAFMDALDPGESLIPVLPGAGTVVLRSFGKMFGLAGLRLGFAVASPDLAPAFRSALGPWAVSGPAIAIGTRALQDRAWIAAARLRLAREAGALDGLLGDAGFTLRGGTPLFRLTEASDAAQHFARLARAGILTRPFAARPHWLRFGLPADAAAQDRLGKALR